MDAVTGLRRGMEGITAKAMSKAGAPMLPMKRPAPGDAADFGAKAPHLAGAPPGLGGACGLAPPLGGLSGALGGLGAGLSDPPFGQLPRGLPGLGGGGFGGGAGSVGSGGGLPDVPGLAPPVMAPPRGLPPAMTPPAGAPGGASSPVAGGSGPQQTASVEVPQSKLGLVLGTNASTIKAIKSISGAQCVIQPQMPGSDRSYMQISGTASQVERCKGLVLALTGDGGAGMDISALLGGGAGKPGIAPPQGLPSPGGVPPMPSLPGLAALGKGGAKFGGGASASLSEALKGLGALPGGADLLGAGLGSNAGGVDVSKLGSLISALGSSSSPGASNYYTQLLTAATHLVSSQGTSETPLETREKPQAFDRDALRRLAQQAQNNAAEEPSAPASSAFVPPPRPPPFQSMPVKSMHNGFAEAPANDSLASAPGFDAPVAAPPPVQEQPAEDPVVQRSAAPPPPAPAPASLPFVPEPMPQTSKKDASSVLKFLQGAQDNIARAQAGRARLGNAQAQLASTGVSATGAAGGAAGARNPWEALCAKLQSVGASTEKLSSDNRRALEKEVMATLPTLEPTRAAELVTKAYAVEPLRNEELLDDLCKALVTNIPRFRSPDLTRITSAFAAWALALGASGDERSRLSEALRAFFSGVSAEVSLRLMDVAPSDLAKISAALASVGVGGVRLFASIARAAVARADRFAPAELISLIGAFDKARCFQTALFEALARCLRMSVRDVTPKDIVKGMLSLAYCGIKDEGLGQAIGEHMPKKAVATGGLLTAEESCTLAWAFCALELHHDKLFRAVFRALEDAPVQASDTLCQLYEIHLTLKAFHQESYSAYELEDDTVQSLREHYRRQRGGSRGVKPERSSERLHGDIAELLREIVDASVSTSYVTSLGFTVDIAAVPRASDGRSRRSTPPLILIDVDGPHSLIRSLDPAESVAMGAASRVRGTLALKRRALEKNGMRMAVFSEDDWRGLDGARDRKEFLRGLLKKAGVPEDKMV